MTKDEWGLFNNSDEKKNTSNEFQSWEAFNNQEEEKNTINELQLNENYQSSQVEKQSKVEVLQIQQPQSLSFKVEAYESILLKSRNDIRNYVKISDGLVFGKVGVDAAIGLLPIVGGLYSAAMGIWLIMQANTIKAGLQEKLFIFLLNMIDVGIGIWIGPGDIVDILFRSHAWSGKRLLSHIDYQLSLINRVREKIDSGVHADISSLEDALFRKGRTKEEQRTMYIAIGVTLLVLFVGCSIL
ncbi:MAG: DUF4112 domain-containing protein [Cyanobacteria bacterium J06600_6]